MATDLDVAHHERERALTVAEQVTVPHSRSTTWYRELALVGAFYGVYTMVRNQFGSASIDPSRAFHNASQLIESQRALGLFVELEIQSMFVAHTDFVRMLNIFYGTLHFIATGGVMIFLYVRHRERYLRWRTVLATTTGLALVGFAAYPLMPPRLLNAGGTWGWRAGELPFVDTLAEVGGLWSFSSEGMQSITNQYAAMPSLHVGWSLWCVAALWVVVPRRVRPMLLLYPAWTVFAIVVTGNHYLLDAVGGGLVLLVGYTAVQLWCDWLVPLIRERRAARPGVVR